MSQVRLALSDIKLIGSAKITLNTTTGTFFDFGTPNDLNLASAGIMAGYRPGDRVLVVVTASTTGTTDSISWLVRDAQDNNGSIGSLADAEVVVVAGALSAGTGDDYSAFSVKVKPTRPWLAVRVLATGTTDTFTCHCTVWAIPNGA